MATDAGIGRPEGPEKADDVSEIGRPAPDPATGAKPSAGLAPGGGAVRGDTEEGSTAQASPAKREYPAHSDGVVCRCAVHWRRETIARGLNRLFAEGEETSDP